ncbi:MAG: 2-amino-4-hydroxy-6-hydroxymethyldihydropteridine diphosphokinase [Granulosicoccus sp.]|nr:2-amino-4-hydroxy-6-hydroxymethyldihydropteridine diphosphokinase [Granulosicoccus sp.]
MAAAFISLGSNIAPEDNLRTAVRHLRAEFGELRLSPVYRSAAVGFEGPDFLNAAAEVISELPPAEIVNTLLQIEELCLRDRNQPRFSSRTLDLDLLMLGELVIEEDRLTLPRPEILEEEFVLRPLADIADTVRHPLAECTIGELLHRFQSSEAGARVDLIRVELALE